MVTLHLHLFFSLSFSVPYWILSNCLCLALQKLMTACITVNAGRRREKGPVSPGSLESIHSRAEPHPIVLPPPAALTLPSWRGWVHLSVVGGPGPWEWNKPWAQWVYGAWPWENSSLSKSWSPVSLIFLQQGSWGQRQPEYEDIHFGLGDPLTQFQDDSINKFTFAPALCRVSSALNSVVIPP